MPHTQPNRKVSPISLMLFLLVLGVFLGRIDDTFAAVTGRYTFFDPIIDVYSAIDTGYVEDPDKEALQRAAIEGMLDSLDDPYAEFVPPTDFDTFQKNMTGQFVGIGAEVRMQEGPIVIDDKVHPTGYLQIVSPLEDSPAYNAGIMADDLITAVSSADNPDPVSTLDLSIDECIALLTGQPGTTVTLNVRREGTDDFTVDIVRQRITARAVRGVYRTPGNGHYSYLLDPSRTIAYIRLSQFTPTAPSELAQAIFEIDAGADLGGLILDLRGNPGGMLDAATAIADIFLDEGDIVSVKGRIPELNTTHSAKLKSTLPDFPLLILVDGQSASASEIVSGALQDHNRAIVVGTRTFGKGLVQTVRDIPHLDHAQVKFTTQRYYLPSGRLIQRTDDSDTWGVDPTPGYYIPVTDEELVDRILTRRDYDIIRNGDADELLAAADWDNPNWVKDEFKDSQLAGALTAMQQRLDTGNWTPLSDESNQAAQIALSEIQSLHDVRERYARELQRVNDRIDALESSLATGIAPPSKNDLWDDSTLLEDGTLQIYDKDGNLITTLTITDNNLERWLIDAGVKPVDDEQKTQEQTDEPEPANTDS